MRMDGSSSRTVLMIRHMAERGGDRVAAGLREHGCELDWRCPAEGSVLPVADRDRYAAAVIYGGVQSANDEDKAYIRDEIDWIERWIAEERPLFGICLGAQLLGRALGAGVARHEDGLHEIGYHRIEPAPGANGFLGDALHLYQWHNEGFELPPGCDLLATGETFENQAYRFGRGAYGVQFHPEVTPVIIQTWFEEAGDALYRPGAHPADRQMADAARYDDAARRWTERFLCVWIAEWEHPDDEGP